MSESPEPDQSIFDGVSQKVLHSRPVTMLHRKKAVVTLITAGSCLILVVFAVYEPFRLSSIELRPRYFMPGTPPSISISLLDLWQRSFANSSLLRFAPYGDILPHFTDALYAHQNPPNCATASYFLFHYQNGLGFGAHVKHYIMAFHTALKANRVFLLDESAHFYWTKGCADRSYSARHECYFQPLSRCTYSVVKKLIAKQELSLININNSVQLDQFAAPIIPPATSSPSVVRFSIPEMDRLDPPLSRPFLRRFSKSDRINELPPAFKNALPTLVHREYLSSLPIARRAIQTCLAYYFLRLNPPTAKSVRDELELFFNTSNPAQHTFIGMPVRASDKCFGGSFNGPGEMECVTLEESFAVAQRIALAQPQITHVIVTSEDPTAITDEKISAAQKKLTFGYPLKVIKNRYDNPPGTGAAGGRITRASNAVLLKSMLVTLHLQSQAEYHVLAPRSTYSSLIAVVSKTIPGKRRHMYYPLGTDDSLQSSLSSQIM